MHFKLDELEEYPEIRAIAQKLLISHLLMFLVTIINFVSCLVQGFAIEGEGIRILYTIVYFILFNNMQCYFFYTGYKSVIDEPEIFTRTKILGLILSLAYLIFSIVAWLNWDGWVRYYI